MTKILTKTILTVEIEIPNCLPEEVIKDGVINEDWQTPGQPGYISIDEALLKYDPEDDNFYMFRLVKVEDATNDH